MEHPILEHWCQAVAEWVVGGARHCPNGCSKVNRKRWPVKGAET